MMFFIVLIVCIANVYSTKVNTSLFLQSTQKTINPALVLLKGELADSPTFSAVLGIKIQADLPILTVNSTWRKEQFFEIDQGERNISQLFACFDAALSSISVYSMNTFVNSSSVTFLNNLQLSKSYFGQETLYTPLSGLSISGFPGSKISIWSTATLIFADSSKFSLFPNYYNYSMCRTYFDSSYNCSEGSCSDSSFYSYSLGTDIFATTYSSPFLANYLSLKTSFFNASIPSCDTGYEKVGYICHLCPANFITIFEYGSNSQNCAACPSFSVPNLNQTDCICPVGYVTVSTSLNSFPNALSVAFNCLSCPVGFNCSISGLNVVVASLLPGYWRSSLTSLVPFACPYPGACLGGSNVGEKQCATGFDGVFCGSCSDGYFKRFIFYRDF